MTGSTERREWEKGRAEEGQTGRQAGREGGREGGLAYLQ